MFVFSAMGTVFKGATAFNSDISKWNTGNVINMNNSTSYFISSNYFSLVHALISNFLFFLNIGEQCFILHTHSMLTSPNGIYLKS